MAGPAYAARRARSRSGQLAAFAGVVLMVSAALATIGGAILPVLDTGSRELVAQSGPTASAMRIESRLAAGAQAAADQDATLQGLVTEALRGLPAAVFRSLTVEAEVVVHGQPVHVQLLADPSLPASAELTAGAWPTSADEVAIQDAAAAALRLAPGDVVALGPRSLRVSGTWHAPDPAAPRWFGDPAIASGAEDDAAGPVLADESVLLAAGSTPSGRWTVVPDPGSLDVTRLGDWSDALARLDAGVRRTDGDPAVQLSGDLPATLARAARVTTVAGGVLGLPIVLVVLAGAIVLTLIARSLAAGRGGEFVLLRARGASLPALAAAATAEASGAALVGAALGGAAGWVVLSFLLPGRGTAPASPVLLVTVPLGVALLAGILALAVTVAELRAPVTGRAESGRAAVVASIAPLALALVAAGLALAQFLSLGSPVVVRSDGSIRTDPVALSAPVLVLLAACLAAPAIAGPVVAVAERVARTGRGILPVLPLRQLARRARSVAAGVLVMALAAGAVLLALQFRASVDAARLAAEHAATGADLRITLPVRTSVEPDAPGAGAAVLEGVDGVDDAFAVLDTIASVGPDPVPLIAADPGRLAAAASSSPDLRALVPVLGSARREAALPADAAELLVRFGVSRGQGVPAGLVAGVTFWFADGDGGALRVEAGSIPLESGSREVTSAVPSTARALLAVDVRPPALGDGTVGVGVEEVRAGTAPVAFAGGAGVTLRPGTVQRFLPVEASDSSLPVVVGSALADRLGLGVGSGFRFRVASVSAALPAEVVGIVDRLPGSGEPLGMVVDLAALVQRAAATEGSVPAANQLWVVSAHPDAVAGSVRSALTVRAGIVAPRTLSPAPVLGPAVALVLAGVAVTALLAFLGFAAVAASVAQRRRSELTPLRSLGLTSARIRTARAIELLTTAVLAVLLGAGAGWLTALLVVPGLTGVLA